MTKGQNYAARRILIADDEPTAAEMMAYAARTLLGCPLECVADGDQALEALSQRVFDVVITDMLMPGCHGLELIARIRKQWPQVDVLVVTAYAVEFPYVSVIEAGASDFIVKPFHPQEMQAKLMRLFTERELREEVAREQKRILDDIESMQRLRAEQAGAEKKYRSLFELSMEGMLMLDAETYVIREANRAFCALSGKTIQELAAAPLLELLDPADRARLEHVLPHFSRMGQGTLSGVTLRERAVSLDLTATFIDLAPERILLVACRDVTEQLEIQERLGTIAQTDELTGLYNYRTFSLEIENGIARARTFGQPLSLMFLDLDNFKQCNDTYGHQTGDAVLRAAGDLIRRLTRAGDMAFRYGGDEFAVVLKGADATVGARVADRMRSQFNTIERYGTSMSVGISQYRQDMDATAFVRSADEALYRAKALGKNAVCVA